MGLHSFIEYLKYQWKAKGRHGVHSPFVYDLIENVLLDKGWLKKEDLVKCPQVSIKYENLICRIATYYHYKEVVCLPCADRITHADMLLINAAPAEWQSLLHEYLHTLKNDSAVIITGIHTTPDHSAFWKKLISDTHVRMSIDLYGIGILFFKEEFKEKQHFVLRY